MQYMRNLRGRDALSMCSITSLNLGKQIAEQIAEVIMDESQKTDYVNSGWNHVVSGLEVSEFQTRNHRCSVNNELFLY